MQPAIVVAGLRKRCGGHTALADIDLEVRSGEVVGLLGPNGAGKSTALAVLATLLAPDEGTVAVAGHALPAAAPAARRALGYVPPDSALYPALTARENLRFFSGMLGLDRGAARVAVARALDLVALAAYADDPVATYSDGMRRRLNLACGLLHAPRVLLLDEPTAGVDPRSHEYLHAAIAAAAADGAGVLIATHDTEEAERLCARTLLLDAGRIVASGPPADLVGTCGIAASLRLRTLRPPPPDWLDGLASVRVLAASGTRSALALDDPAALPVVLARAARAGGDVVELRFERPTLADVFFARTGHGLQDGDGSLS